MEAENDILNLEALNPEELPQEPLQDSDRESRNPVEEIADVQKQEAVNKGAVTYLSITGAFFLVIFAIFTFFPRPEYSELEKRDLQTFPKFEEHKNNLPGYTAAISDWFSNTEPFRDSFLTMSMGLRNSMKFNFRSDDDAVSFIATADSMEGAQDARQEVLDDEFAGVDELDIGDLAEENAKVANAGIIVAGNAPNARAMMAFGGSEKSAATFISTVNKYAETFPNQNIYVLVAPSSGEYYMPEKVKSRNKPEGPMLENIKQNIAPGVKYVNAHDALKLHAHEDIFLRTDHHWAPLGAFYAAEQLAKTANVPFKGLDSYDQNVVHRFVGSMYGYSKDISVKNSPEDFVYYTPKGLDYTTTFVTYNTNKAFQVTGVSAPYKSSYFKKYSDGNGSAYCTFMGGDQHLVHVQTGTPSNRKLLIIKDSFGNAIPGYMFYSFSDVHVVDFRYFNRNMKKYVEENGITDIAFVFNVFNVCNSTTFKKVERFLSLRDGEISSPGPKDPVPAAEETPSESSAPESEETLSPVSETPSQSSESAPVEPASTPAEPATSNPEPSSSEPTTTSPDSD